MAESKDAVKPSARDTILATAASLFFREGFRAVGVDTIIAQAAVAKMTLYRHFPSKDDLIVAYLQEMNTQFWRWFDASIQPAEGRAADQVIAFFEALEKLVTTPQCYGCPFLNAVVDFPDANHPGHRVALEHKQAVRARFRELAYQAGAHKAEVLADQLLLLMDGAFMAVRMFGVDNPAVQVAQAAAALLAAHTAPRL